MPAERLLSLVAALLSLPTIAGAQIILPTPAAPVVVTPAVDATVQAVAPNQTTVQLRWNQWGVLNTPTQPLPAFFVVCIKPTSQTQNCTFTASSYLAVASISATKLYNGFQHAGWQYTYTMQPGSIADSLLDRAATLSVGACRSASVSACTFSAPRALWMAAVDLRAHNVSNVSTATHVVLQFIGKNEGTTTITTSTSTLTVAWEALLNGNAQCRVDINAADVRNDPNIVVLLADGSNPMMTDLPVDMASGNRVAPGTVVGMHRWIGGSNRHVAWPVFSLAIPPGVRATLAELIFPENVRPKGYVGVMRADDTRVLREFDETNNGKAECSVLL